MDNINIISDEQLYHSLIGIILLFVSIFCFTSVIDNLFYLYHKWIKKDLSITAIKTNWKTLL